MPQEEIVAFLQAGEQAIVTGPGTLELKIPKAAAVMAKATGGAVGKGVVTGGVAAGGTGLQSAILTGGGSASMAQSWPVSLASGKILGFNLAAVNPWILLGVGAIGGYLYLKKRRFRLF